MEYDYLLIPKGHKCRLSKQVAQLSFNHSCCQLNTNWVESKALYVHYN
jgi:hypothetical protein